MSHTMKIWKKKVIKGALREETSIIDWGGTVWVYAGEKNYGRNICLETDNGETPRKRERCTLCVY